MDKNQFKYFTDHPETLSYAEVSVLEQLIKRYPYFQLARVLHLRALKNIKNRKFNICLTQTAIYTIQREALFSFIEGKEFILNDVFDSESQNITVERHSSKMTAKTPEESPEKNIAIVKQLSEDKDKIDKEQVYDLDVLKNSSHDDVQQQGKDLDLLTETSHIKKSKSKKKKKRKKKHFNLNASIEKHKRDKSPKDLNQVTLNKKYTFTEWLKLSNNTNPSQTSKQGIPSSKKSKVWQPIIIDTPRKSKKKEKRKKNEDELNRKIEIINKFLEQDPRIVPQSRTENKNLDINRPFQIKSSFEKQELMTETLARVYIEQKKYDQAIESFKILQLKNPKKNSYFASEIEKINQLKSEKK